MPSATPDRTIPAEGERRPLEPERTPAQKRMTNLHITAYPGLLNTEFLPEAARQVTDFTLIDPTLHRKNHAVRNNNVTTFTTLTNGKSRSNDGISMMTEKQITARLTSIGIEMRKAAEAERNACAAAGDGGPSPTSVAAATAAASKEALCPKGYHTQLLAPPYDPRSTYRVDYCQEGPSGFQDAARRACLANYRAAWSAEEKRDIAASMKQPFLTCPNSVCQDQSTEYRAEYMPEAEGNDFRLLSHKTNLPELGTTFAYSAYSLDDPRRRTDYDAEVASLKEPRGFLDSSNNNKSSSNTTAAATASGTTKSGNSTGDAHALEQMRTLCEASAKRQQLQRDKRHAAAAADVQAVVDRVNGVTSSESDSGNLIQSRRPADYIYYPRSQFI